MIASVALLIAGWVAYQNGWISTLWDFLNNLFSLGSDVITDLTRFLPPVVLPVLSGVLAVFILNKVLGGR